MLIRTIEHIASKCNVNIIFLEFIIEWNNELTPQHVDSRD